MLTGIIQRNTISDKNKHFVCWFMDTFFYDCTKTLILDCMNKNAAKEKNNVTMTIKFLI